MKIPGILLTAVLILSQGSLFAQAWQPPARVDSFTPTGAVKQVRQVQVRFSESMVPFGDLRDVAEPFTIACAEPGKARWIDDRVWVYDFDRDLPAGIRCEFKIREGLETLAGKTVAGPGAYTFSTGGPAILQTKPYQGNIVAEDQVFILQLDADATDASVIENVYFAVDGIASRVGARIVTGNERDSIIKSEYRYYDRPPEHLLLIQARQHFPVDTRVTLVWGKGVAALNGVTADADQSIPFKTRADFAARFTCERVNAEAACLPISPMRVTFTAPVSAKAANAALLTAKDGEKRHPADSGETDDDATVYSITFEGPFPELSEFTIELPSGLRDDAGRALLNAGEFPLTVHTDDYPPLAKFAASFGILELKDSPVLPVTMRNIEASVTARILDEEGTPEAASPERAAAASARISGKARGRVVKTPVSMPEIFSWMQKVQRQGWWSDRDKSIFDDVPEERVRKFDIRKPQGAAAFEVVGIPLNDPGFYVVEIESEILGSALLGKPAPMYVSAAALVTNLSVHFKWGNESSLVWVTQLNNASPAAGAEIQILDCEGKTHWQGKTDKNGTAMTGKLPVSRELPYCSNNALGSELAVVAKAGEDMSFALTNWDSGIEPWRFGLPMEWNPNPNRVHTVFDRTLFRPGETAHMKHILRRRVMSGFAELPAREINDAVTIIHIGSDQKYEIPLSWNPDGSAESEWEIPRDARLGNYSVYLNSAGKPNESAIYTGNFRVEEFRVPLMRAVVRAPAEDQVAPEKITVDLTANYLSGGGAGHLPVKFRYLLGERYYIPTPEDYDGFSFNPGKVIEGVRRSEDEDSDAASRPSVKSLDLTLDAMGAARTVIDGLPEIGIPMNILAELDFKDPNGETQTVSTNIPLWPAAVRVGIKPDGWTLSRDALKFQVAVIDLGGKPVAGTPVKVNLFEQRTYSHRTRLVGGFYAYSHSIETRRIQLFCEGKTNPRGLVFCEGPTTVSGNIVLEATANDSAGREAAASTSVWVVGDRDWWFTASDSDRMDVLPEAKRYEPGDKARFQIRMPFPKATALITVEREGISEVFVRELSGKEPVIELPVRGNWAPNVFISVLAVRGRADEVQPTAMVDLGRPAFRLGVAEIQVGWKAHELKVLVSPEKPVYKVRDKARVKISVTTADGSRLSAGSEIAIAAVDEGLLELMPNNSWNLLDEMMGRRSYGVRTYTAQMQVIGKRHFGLKALPQGGGGGQGMTRELFDTLLLWKGNLKLNARGEAEIEIPLNDSLTSFRVVAVATGGVDRFGTGSASFRTTQDLILFSGIPPLARSGDRFAAIFTARNATELPMRARFSLKTEPAAGLTAPQEVSLEAGESREIRFDLTAPEGIDEIRYTLEASADGGAADRIAVTQKILPAVPVRTMQATLTQLDGSFSIPVERPAGAVRNAGELRVAFQARLTDSLDGVIEYMSNYPYTCLEQQTSKAVALRNFELWKSVMAKLPAYLDSDGLAKYFTVMRQGDDTLTAYLISIAHEAGWEIPANARERMLDGLRGFVEGRVTRDSDMPTSDLAMRKLAAVGALAREGKASPDLLSSITIAPQLWPTSAVIDWLNILTRMNDYRNREANIREAQQILRSRLNMQGSTMGFSTERSDRLWWLMVSIDSNAVRLLLSELEHPEWRDDIPRLVRGALGRQKFGRWDTTVANAWGRLAMEKFSDMFENVPVTGKSAASLAGRTKAADWQADPKGTALSFPWPESPASLDLEMNGTGKPWATIQSLAAVPLKEPLSSGFKITRTIVPVTQKTEGVWTAGDIMRVRLEIESQSDMTWVVINDPVPSGASILGTGLGRDSALLTRDEEREGRVWPAFEERSFEAYREYYRFVPKGKWVTEYTLRLNNPGLFQLPPSRVEALYAPEMFGESPIPEIEVK
ncbi:MAG: MG2 domain-containing protein [Acidobacteria bacterium]|nr:MG2 domain-containing protein [Acidobacteriota bacterium]